MLLEQPMEVNRRTEEGWTLLYLTLELGPTAPIVVKLLLNAGADPRLKDAKSYSFETTVPTKIVRIMCVGMRQSITPIPKESKSRLVILAILEMDLKPGWLLHNVLGKFSRRRSVPFHK
jgi:hypothetical protein